jgi:hypothetical protein
MNKKIITLCNDECLYMVTYYHIAYTHLQGLTVKWTDTSVQQLVTLISWNLLDHITARTSNLKSNSRMFCGRSNCLIGKVLFYLSLRRKATRVWAGGSGFLCSSPGRGWKFFCSPPRPARLWYPPSLLSNEYHGQSGRGRDYSPPSSAEVKECVEL